MLMLTKRYLLEAEKLKLCFKVFAGVLPRSLLNKIPLSPTQTADLDWQLLMNILGNCILELKANVSYFFFNYTVALYLLLHPNIA